MLFDFRSYVNNTALLYKNLRQSGFVAYISNPGSDTRRSTFGDDEVIEDNIELTEDGLRFIRNSQQPMDTSTSAFGGLRPRTELSCEGKRLDRGCEYEASYEFTMLRGASQMHGYLFQVIDYETTGGVLPNFQLYATRGKLHVTHRRITDNGKMRGMKPNRVAEFKDFTTYKFFYQFKMDNKNGYIRVFLNGDKVFEFTGRTTSKSNKQPKIQFGVYGKPEVQLESMVHCVMWSKLDKQPIVKDKEEEEEEDDNDLILCVGKQKWRLLAERIL